MGIAKADDHLPSRRFVVLRHEQGDTVHFDLMIDEGSTLTTWQCPEPPEAARFVAMRCIRSGDHRRLYLDYEGPISGDRGCVSRHDKGTCRLVWRDSGGIELFFEGQRLVGRYELTGLGADQSWSLRFLGE